MKNYIHSGSLVMLIITVLIMSYQCSEDKDIAGNDSNNNNLPNQAPVLAPIGPRTINAAENINFNVSAIDPDSTIPSLLTSLLPSGAGFTDNDDGTGTFDWIPGSNQIGDYNVTFYATDDSSAVDSEVVIITVVLENHAPELAAIGPQATDEGTNLDFEVTASDIDGTTPSLSTSTLPTGAGFTDDGDGTGDFNWTPDGSQSGIYQITFHAGDGLLTDSEVVTITVNDTGTISGAIIADHLAAADFDNVPESIIRQVRANYNIFYGHTSHGRQIMTGLIMLESEDTLYSYGSTGNLPFQEFAGDLGHAGSTTWVPVTTGALALNNNLNVVMWSWCAGVEDNTETGINIYLNAMNQLESDYPNVTFVYMTGHLDGTGPSGNLYIRNQQIRDYCTTNNKILFDFADIESFDPDGNNYPNDNYDCTWCNDWCQTNNCPSCTGVDCPHSHCFNCYLKGKAFWWMMARVAGWSGK